MSPAQTTGGYRCDACGMTFNSLLDLGAHTREKHKTRSAAATIP